MFAPFTYCYFDMELVFGICIFEVEFQLICAIGVELEFI